MASAARKPVYRLPASAARNDALIIASRQYPYCGEQASAQSPPTYNRPDADARQWRRGNGGRAEATASNVRIIGRKRT